MTEPAYKDKIQGTTSLITGGAGFIGSHIARRLLDLGAKVRVIDDLTTGHEANVPEGAEFINASILDDDALRRAADGCRYVFHHAAMVSVPLSVEQPQQCAEINTLGTQKVIDAAVAGGAKRIMFASSAAVYGDEPQLPSTEADRVSCASPYAASKASGELLLHAASAVHDLSTASLRYFNVFGPRQDPKSAYAAVISAFADRLIAGEQPTIFGDGKQTRDFVYIDNVVHANLLAATSDTDLRGERINIGAAGRISLLDLLAGMNDALGTSIEPTFSPPRAGDVLHSSADIDKAREIIGYEPIVEFKDGIRETLEWFRDN